MSDAGTEPMTEKTAGALLREARIAQGIHIAAMSASIKVAQRKLELLEADRYDELPDATFTRALAQTMCRVLKIDAEPVLSRLRSVATPVADLLAPMPYAGLFAAVDKVHVHDIHATMLHLMGLDHEELSYFHQGREETLTDVYGRVIQEILA